jgi:hypothetical protein
LVVASKFTACFRRTPVVVRQSRISEVYRAAVESGSHTVILAELVHAELAAKICFAGERLQVRIFAILLRSYGEKI